VCEESIWSGEYTGTKTVGNIEVTFGKKCTAEKTCECESVHAGILEMNTLEGELQWENKALKHVALDLFPAVGTPLFIEFVCGPITIKWRGSVLVNIKSGKMETKPAEKYSGLNGKQKPEFYETAGGEEVRDIIEDENSLGKKFEQQGITETITRTNEEALEVNWFV
jgi:hypothetical protein